MTEQLRLQTYRRFLVFVNLLPTTVAIALAGALIDRLSLRIQDVPQQSCWAAFLAEGEIVGFQALRIGALVHGYGNGAPIETRRAALALVVIAVFGTVAAAQLWLIAGN